jgi:tetratricopeptide (TPR) repeat protein
LDLDYDISAGRYDLNIENEFGDRLVNLVQQKNAVNQPSSTVNKFSFIGDLGDKENASYYVDDVMLSTGAEFNQADFVAPGRRKLFVDSWDDYHQQLYGKIQCIPGVQSIDFGIDIDVFHELLANKFYDILNQLLEGKGAEPGSWQSNRYLSAIEWWQQGCSDLQQKNWQQAITSFEKANELVGNARLYTLSLALAYSGAGNYDQSDLLLASMQSDWVNDQRLAVAYAMIGIARKDLYAANQWLAQAAQIAIHDDGLEVLKGLHCNVINSDMITQLKNYDPENWPRYLQQVVITEQYYFSLLWQKNYHDALYYAIDMSFKLDELGLASSKWRERAGDAAFYSGAYDQAITYYESAIEVAGSCYCNYLKLSDIYFITGDVQKEREFREKIYGRFEEIY